MEQDDSTQPLAEYLVHSGCTSVVPLLSGLTVSWKTAAQFTAIGAVVIGGTYFLVRSGKQYDMIPWSWKNRQVTKSSQMSRPVLGPSPSIRDGESLQLGAGDGVSSGRNPLENSSTRITQLRVYPIKSCRGIAVDSFYCGGLGPEYHTEHGVIRDRCWMVTTSNYVFLTQRRKPKMALITPSIEGSFLAINAPGMQPLAIPIHPDTSTSTVVKTSVWGDDIDAVDCGDEAGVWFSTFLEQDGLRLLHHPWNGRNLSSAKEENSGIKLWEDKDKCAFADGAPYLLLSEESMADLNTRLKNSVPWTNFRPNILVAGCEPYDEDVWSRFRIGQAEFRNAKLCTRCVMTTVDTEAGSLSRKDVLEALKKYRVNQTAEWKSTYENHPLLSINLGIDHLGSLAVGDTIIHLS